MTGTEAERPASALGTVEVEQRRDEAVLFLDVDFDIESIQAGWPEFESRFTSLRGRQMMALVLPEQRVYRLATLMRDEDDPDALRLRMGVLPGGKYLRLSLEGDAREVHRRIGPAFEELRGLGDVDPTRPCVEVYVSSQAVDCLLPVRD